MVERMSREELKQLALDMLSGAVFTNMHVSAPEQLGLVFMLLGFLNDEQAKELADIGLIYEYMSKAGPRSVNGMPIFMSARFVHKDDMPELTTIIKKLQLAIKEVG